MRQKFLSGFELAALAIFAAALVVEVMLGLALAGTTNPMLGLLVVMGVQLIGLGYLWLILQSRHKRRASRDLERRLKSISEAIDGAAPL
ncbi:hypothetical protein ACMA5I_02930 [Paracoccaceae bacterium GXU_MW_L88]